MAISMNFFSRMMFGLGFANAILLALVDNKVTPQEIVSIMQFAISGLGVELKLTLDDIQMVPNEDGSVSLTFSKRLVDKLNFAI